MTSACFSPTLKRAIGLGLLERGFERKGETVTEMQMLQNKAMFARIKYQAAAVVVVAVIALLAS